MKVKRVHITLTLLLFTLVIGGLVGVSIICFEQKKQIRLLKKENEVLNDASDLYRKAYKLKVNQLNNLQK